MCINALMHSDTMADRQTSTCPGGQKQFGVYLLSQGWFSDVQLYDIYPIHIVIKISYHDMTISTLQYAISLFHFTVHCMISVLAFYMLRTMLSLYITNLELNMSNFRPHSQVHIVMYIAS